MVWIKLMYGEKKEGRERDKVGKNGGHEGQELKKKRRYRGVVRRKEGRDEGMKGAQASGMLVENGKKNQRFQSFIKNFAHNHGKLKWDKEHGLLTPTITFTPMSLESTMAGFPCAHQDTIHVRSRGALC